MMTFPREEREAVKANVESATAVTETPAVTALLDCDALEQLVGLVV